MILLLISFLFSFLVTGLLVRYNAYHLSVSGDHDFTGPQKFHQNVTPRIGGIGIALGCLFMLGIYALMDTIGTLNYNLIALSSIPIFLAGLIEDLTKQVNNKIRLYSAFFSGLLFLYLFEIYTIRLGIPILDTLMANQVVTIAFLAFAIAGLTHAFNIIDGLNGLASMVAIISSTVILYVAIDVQDQVVINLTLVIIGSTAGFFIWNFPRGLIFLGDGGAYLIGFLIAISSILLVINNPTVSPWFALMVNSYPIFETLFTIWRRTIRRNKNPLLPDGAHFHSLIYRRIIRLTINGGETKNTFINNSKASLFLWLLASLGAIPALLWWDKTINLVISSFIFIVLYIYFYRMVLKTNLPFKNKS